MAAGQNKVEARAANDPNAVVMRAVYDNEFEPWSKERLVGCVEAHASQTRGFDNATDARNAAARAASSQPDAAEFARLHPLLFQQLTDPDFVRREGMVGLLLEMIDLQCDVQSGRVAEPVARARVSDRALQVVMASTPKE